MLFYTWLQPDFSSDISAEKEFLYSKHQPLLPAILLVCKESRNRLLKSYLNVKMEGNKFECLLARSYMGSLVVTRHGE